MKPIVASAGKARYEVPLDREIAAIEAALDMHGGADRRELRRRVGARLWGPGRFTEALAQAIAEGRARRLPRGRVAPAREPDGEGPPPGMV